MSLLLAQGTIDPGIVAPGVGHGLGVATVVGVGLIGFRGAVGVCVGLASVVGVGRDGDAVSGSRRLVRTIYETDPPNRFWPDPSIHTY